MEEKNLERASLVNGRSVDRWLLRMFLKDMEKIQMLNQEEEASITRRCRTGDEASRNRLVESNLRFVVKVAFQYWSPGLPLMDMISEGCQGLIKAAKTFDPNKGFRFLTYAGNSIGQGVIKAIKEHTQYEHNSLDELIGNDGSETSQRDVMASKDQQCDEMAFYNQVRDLLDRLSDKERLMVTLRFWDGLTLEEIGLRINVGKETARQIEARALRKLRWAIDERQCPG